VSLRNCAPDSIAGTTPRRIQHFKPAVVANGMRRLLLFTCVLALAGCSTSSDYDDEPRMRPRGGAMSDDGAAGAGAQMMGGLMMPPADWWRQAEIADLVKPTADQVAALDKLQTEQGDEIAKLERDMGIAERDLRNVLETDKPSNEAIVTAGQRIKTMRDDVFDRQLRFLAAERIILTREQWSSLQDAMRARRRDRTRGEGGRGPGRGAYPGRGGRRPGRFPGW